MLYVFNLMTQEIQFAFPNNIADFARFAELHIMKNLS